MSSSYRFGPFSVDRTRYSVQKGANPVELTPKLLDLLIHLLDHAGELVTKEALLDALWPSANVTDNALAQAVSELRRALGDDAGAPHFIKTIARRGYRFIGPVQVIRAGAALAGEADAPGAQSIPATPVADDLGLPRPLRGPARAARETPSLAAYRGVSEGWMRLESLDVREIPRAVADFERAVEADPRYALAYTGLASAELALYETTRSDNEPANAFLSRAVEHARYAVQLDDRSAEAHATLAHVLVSRWETVEAGAAARTAVSLEPSNWRHLFRLSHASWGNERLDAARGTLALYPDFAFAHFQMAMVHVARGHLVDAESVLRQGAAVQDRLIGRGGRYPALGLHWLLGLVRMADDDLDEALDQFDQELRLAEPHRLYGREYAMYALHGRGAALLEAGRSAEAVESFQGALKMYPDHAPSHLGLALSLQAHPAAGDSAHAFRRVGEAIESLTRARPIEAAMVRAQLLVATGDHEEAVAALDTLLGTAPPGFAAWTLGVEPLLRQLHEDDGFARILGALAGRAT
ncbi:MAG TPA: winged helix-turn-helix domain-containing protein [Vicinamibacterales bacterium]|nr:winged helix-turn-helix domain-containing protein [Vicinamibacterales bacterium]